MSEVKRGVPGIPPIVRTEVGLEILDQLWTLSYLRYNTIKTCILLLPKNTSVADAVEIGKKEARARNASFSYMEPAIKDLRNCEGESTE